jgi:hypothetical protein
MEETNDGLQIILPRFLYDASITISPAPLTRNKAGRKNASVTKWPPIFTCRLWKWG